MAFVHFGIHTEFSITDSIVRIKALVKAAKADNQLALAISDLSNLYATVKFYKACLDAGIKPIIGSEVWLENDSTTVTLLASNQVGYKNLTNIVSKGFVDGQVMGKPIIQRDWIFERSEGCLLYTSPSPRDVEESRMPSSA